MSEILEIITKNETGSPTIIDSSSFGPYQYTKSGKLENCKHNAAKLETLHTDTSAEAENFEKWKKTTEAEELRFFVAVHNVRKDPDNIGYLAEYTDAAASLHDFLRHTKKVYDRWQALRMQRFEIMKLTV